MDAEMLEKIVRFLKVHKQAPALVCDSHNNAFVIMSLEAFEALHQNVATAPSADSDAVFAQHNAVSSSSEHVANVISKQEAPEEQWYIEPVETSGLA